MIRYIVTAAITLTVGVLLGIGIAETTKYRRLTEAESRSEDLEFALNDTQDLLAGAQRNLDFWREREASVRKELVATRIALAAAKPPTEAELEEIAVPLAQLVGEDDANDAEWQRLKQANLDAPAKRWSTATGVADETAGGVLSMGGEHAISSCGRNSTRAGLDRGRQARA